MGILARLRLAKIRTMARPNSPDMPPKRTKKVRLGIKIGTEVGCDQIFQKPLWLSSLTFSSGVLGGVPFVALLAPKIQPSRGHFESAIKPHW